jgi:uncharacterized protein YabE (DUF348 family)
VNSSLLRRVAAAGACGVVAIAGVAVASVDKAVDLTVEGQLTSMHVFGSTVADALAKQGITVGAHDLVVPSATSEISDGTSIVVRYGRKLTVTVDGQTADYWTTATTVDQALAELGIRTADGAQLSVSRSAGLGREGLALTVTNPHAVTVTVDGATKAAATHASTVAGVLLQLEITPGPLDRVTPGVDAAVTEGLAITVQRVEHRSVTSTQVVPFPTTKQDDATLAKGSQKVLTKGVDGQRTVTTTEVWVDGTLEGSIEAGAQVTKAPVTKVVAVGTKAVAAPTPAPAPAAPAPTPPPPSGGAGLNLANAAMWDRIAKCESGGNWHINTGNGYYGGLQFDYRTWLSVGGADFASRADLASREQQITVANRLYAKRGLQPWGCRWAA